MANGAQTTIATDQLTWPTITAQNGSLLTWIAGGIVTNLTLTTSSRVDKSQDARALTITNSTIDGDTCQVNDPLNAITWTNATSVKQQVVSGPFLFTGTRTVKKKMMVKQRTTERQRDLFYTSRYGSSGNYIG